MERRNTVLIIEDNRQDRLHIEAVLQSQPYTLHFAADGAAGLALFEQLRPDLVMLDIILPDMDGYEVFRRLRQHREQVHVPVLFYSVVQALDERLLGLEIGASDFLSKNADERELLVRIKNLLTAKRQLEEMVKLSFTDGLTNVYNRRYFQHRLQDEFRRGRRFNSRFSFAILDIDHFKQINDSSGHISGDRVLKRVAKLLLEQVRDSDIVCRYGGDEFGWLMPETDLQGAYIAVERVRRNFPSAGEEIGKSVTASCGTSAFSDEVAVPDDLISMADKALYKAKQSGRNQTRTAVRE